MGIFKANDIRGVYPQEINEKTAYFIGKASCVFYRRLYKKNPQIILGNDNRLSSPYLKRGFKKGFLEEGGNIIEIGLSTTPLMYFSTIISRADGGVEITASHNPPKFNGFKLVKRNAKPIYEKSGLKEIQKIFQKKDFKKRKKGKIIKKSFLKEYIKFNLNFLREKTLPFTIVVDTANAAASFLIKPILEKIKGLKVYHLFSKLDGSFPNHEPDPLKKENLKALKKEVKEKKADLGVAFDGDGDRIIFIDEKARIISGDLITALVALSLLEEKRGIKILYDVRSSRAVEQAIKKAGGEPVVWKVGHSFIKEKMRKENIIFGGELSGHYYLKENQFCEAPFFVLFRILEEMKRKKKKLSQLVQPLKKYAFSGEINFEVEDTQKVLEKIEKIFSKKGKISKLDGVRVDFKDWWFLVRASKTEPLLRLIVEAKNKKILKEKVKLLKKLIKT